MKSMTKLMVVAMILAAALVVAPAAARALVPVPPSMLAKRTSTSMRLMALRRRTLHGSFTTVAQWARRSTMRSR